MIVNEFLTFSLHIAEPGDLSGVVAIYNSTVPSRMVTADTDPVTVASRQALGLFATMGFSRWGDLPRVAVLDGVERDLIIVGRRVDGEQQA
ncbi:hypothetical protein ACIP1U_20025 [Cupriavidus sp. NPDC089707]|uniref:hypothetical protein n=1 Tax=Cupriavidus sp. NPDC089707 TaxID=3363963 RepID=UPI0037F3552D